MKHPMQKIKDGRFVKNDIVEYLLDNGGIDLNKIACMDFSDEDRQQFAQLIGYSVSGYGSLSYVSEESCGQAVMLCESVMDEKDARIATLEAMLEECRKHLKGAACSVFRIHPDDLHE